MNLPLDLEERMERMERMEQMEPTESTTGSNQAAETPRRELLRTELAATAADLRLLKRW